MSAAMILHARRPWHGTLFIRNKRADEYNTQNMDAQKISNFQSDKEILFIDTIVECATEDCHAVCSILTRKKFSCL